MSIVGLWTVNLFLYLARLLSFAKAIYNNLDHKPIHILEKGLVTGAVTEGGW